MKKYFSFLSFLFLLFLPLGSVVGADCSGGSCLSSANCTSLGGNVPSGCTVNPPCTSGLVYCIPSSSSIGKSCSGKYSSGLPASGNCVAGISCTGGTVFVGACSVSPQGACCAVAPSSGGICTGDSSKKSGTCSSSSGCASGVLEYESGGACKSPNDYCCVPKSAGGGTCSASNCMTSSACNALGKNYSADGSKKCSTESDVCCRLTIDVPVGGGGGGSFPNPLGLTTVEAFLGAILNALQGIIVLLALVFIVFGALVYVASGGNDKGIELAKKAIFAAMIGLALGIAAPSFLKEIAKILGWGSDKLPSQVTASATITTILFNVLNFFLGILGVLALIMLIIGAFMYVASAGSSDMIERGKKIVVWSSVGVVVAFSSLILINQIANFF